jgi:hypothetical protein
MSSFVDYKKTPEEVAEDSKGDQDGVGRSCNGFKELPQLETMGTATVEAQSLNWVHCVEDD